MKAISIYTISLESFSEFDDLVFSFHIKKATLAKRIELQ